MLQDGTLFDNRVLAEVIHEDNTGSGWALGQGLVSSQRPGNNAADRGAGAIGPAVLVSLGRRHRKDPLPEPSEGAWS